MDRIPRIIAGIDQHSPDTAAADLGARLANTPGTTLELYTPVYNSRLSLAHFENRQALHHARELLVKRHSERLEALAAQLRCAGRVECHAAWDHPQEEALIRRVLDSAASLLVVALPPPDASAGRPLSSAQWQLVRHCPAPVLLTRGHPWRDTPTVVAAVDPGGRRNELDVAILQMADTLAAGTGGTLHALHAWERGLRALIGDREETLAPDLPETETERCQREAVYAALKSAGVAPARVSLVEGRPEQVLPEYCRESSADVIVMGAIARNPLGRIFIGSTAERLLDRLPCDLLVVKPDTFRTPVPRERWPRDEGGTPMLGVPGI
jgi:universal stress protein E